MNIDELSDKLTKIQKNLQKESLKYNETIKKLSNCNFDNPIDEDNIKKEYYSTLDPSEREYQKKNDEYKKLISKFSYAYLEMSDFYVGPELPREQGKTYLDSKDEINTLYFLFMMSLFLK